MRRFDRKRKENIMRKSTKNPNRLLSLNTDRSCFRGRWRKGRRTRGAGSKQQQSFQPVSMFPRRLLGISWRVQAFCVYNTNMLFTSGVSLPTTGPSRTHPHTPHTYTLSRYYRAYYCGYSRPLPTLPPRLMPALLLGPWTREYPAADGKHSRWYWGGRVDLWETD